MSYFGLNDLHVRMLLVNVYVLRCVHQWNHSQWTRRRM